MSERMTDELPTELSDYDTCEEHEITFLNFEGCPWCMRGRIAELEAWQSQVRMQFPEVAAIADEALL